jgi:UV DNA damage endonuclease
MDSNGRIMYGYACINMGLREEGIYTNRTLRKKTLLEKGYDYLSEIIVTNLTDLVTIMHHNEQEGIRFFRLSSEIFPFWSHPEFGYNLEDLADADTILSLLKEVGDFATTHNHRLSTHPGPFNVLASPSESVVSKAIIDLECHSKMFDYMGFTPSPYNKINIHVGGAYGEPEAALARFCENFKRLSPNLQARLTVENDDRANLYSTLDLYNHVHKVIGIPIVFDYHHHIFNTGGQTEQEALELAISTWPSGITPAVHYSESKTIHQGGDKATPAHSDLVYGPIAFYGNTVDVMIEAKHKEKAIASLDKRISFPIHE